MTHPERRNPDETHSLLLLAAALAGSLAACGGTQTAETAPDSAAPVELTVFAAASLTETLTQIAEDYKTAAPDVTLVFNFDSSGTLKTQIQEGAVCDLFLSAGQKQMDQLDASADASVNTEGLDYVLAGSRVDLLENKVTLAVPDGNPKGIDSFDALAAHLAAGDILLAMGNSDVPVGQYTQKILTHYGLTRLRSRRRAASPTAPTSRRSPRRSARAAWTRA